MGELPNEREFGDYAQWPGRAVHDAAGDRLGAIREIYLDRDTGRPEWVLVDVDGEPRFVPLVDAVVGPETIRIAHPTAVVRAAPSIGAESDIGTDQERALYDHYGLGYSAGESESGLPADDPPGPDVAAPGVPGPAISDEPETGDADPVPEAPVPGLPPASPEDAVEPPGPRRRCRPRHPRSSRLPRRLARSRRAPSHRRPRRPSPAAARCPSWAPAGGSVWPPERPRSPRCCSSWCDACAIRTPYSVKRPRASRAHGWDVGLLPGLGVHEDLAQPAFDEQLAVALDVDLRVMLVVPKRPTRAPSVITSSKRAGRRKRTLASATTTSTPRSTITCHGPIASRHSSVTAMSKYAR